MSISHIATCYGDHHAITLAGDFGYAVISDLGSVPPGVYELPGGHYSITMITLCYTAVQNGTFCDYIYYTNEQHFVIDLPDDPVCQLTASAVPHSPSSLGCADGSITLSAVSNACSGYLVYFGGTYHGPFSSGVDTVLSGLIAGTYTVQFFSAPVGCSQLLEVVVPPGPCGQAPTITWNDASAWSCADGAVTASLDAGPCATWSMFGAPHGGTLVGVGSGTSGSTVTLPQLLSGGYDVSVVAGDGFTTCTWDQVVTIGAPQQGCAFPFSLTPLDATGTCNNGELVLHANTGCAWQLNFFRTDSTPAAPYVIFTAYLTSDTLTGLAAGNYLVQAVRTASSYFGEQRTCSTWSSFTIGCVGSSTPVAVRVFLDGPYDPATGLMSDAQRSAGLLPLTEPYTALGYQAVGAGPNSIPSSVLLATGPNAIVDWVVVELRSSGTPGAVTASRFALVQRDGDVVDVDGVSPVTFTVPQQYYHVAVRHRNHLGCMTATAQLLSSVPVVDLTSPATFTYGSNARRSVTGTHGAEVLWAGDVSFDGQVKYTGAGNDRDPILVAVGSASPNNVSTGSYSSRDVNMDGVVKYTGSNNDRDRILLNVGSTTPNNVRVQQLP